MAKQKRSWLAGLARHFAETRKRFPNDKLMILFAVDGALLDSPQPPGDVLEVIRWFQIQGDTTVGLYAESAPVPADMLRALNEHGRPFRVQFAAEFLYMAPGQGAEADADSRIAGIRHYQEAGYRIFAFVGNKPESLAASGKRTNSAAIPSSMSSESYPDI